MSASFLKGRLIQIACQLIKLKVQYKRVLQYININAINQLVCSLTDSKN